MSDYQPDGVFPALPTPMEEYDPENPEHEQYMEQHFADVPAEHRPDRVINYDAMENFLDYLADGGVTGVVPAGCTGHAASLRPSEHVEYVERVADMARERGLEVIAGDGTNVTWETGNLAYQVEENADIDAHLMISPYQNKPMQDGIGRHYEQLAEALDEPIVLYNVPSRTGKNVEAETTVQLADNENIVGVKEASLDYNQIREIGQGLHVEAVDDFVLGSGDDPANDYISQQAGDDSFYITVSGNVDPERTVAVHEAASNGDYDAAGVLNRELRGTDEEPGIHKAMFWETNPLMVTEALNQLGFDFGVPREPLAQRPSAENRERLEDVLDEFGLLDEAA